MKKLTLYTVSRCPFGASDEDFLRNLCTVVSVKKDIKEYLINKAILENWSYYKAWLEAHNENDNPKVRIKYIQIVLEGGMSFFNQFSVKKQVYDCDGIASMMRIFNHCVPTGSSYEKDAEIEYLTNYLENILKTVEKLEK